MIIETRLLIALATLQMVVWGMKFYGTCSNVHDSMQMALFQQKEINLLVFFIILMTETNCEVLISGNLDVPLQMS